jgi:toxin ParE1/3/4
MKLIWSPTADQNLDAIWEYIAQDSVDAADKMLIRLKEAASQLLRFPKIGRSGRSRRTRELVVSGTPYLLIYRVERDKIEIARVIHGRQDWALKG